MKWTLQLLDEYLEFTFQQIKNNQLFTSEVFIFQNTALSIKLLFEKENLEQHKIKIPLIDIKNQFFKLKTTTLTAKLQFYSDLTTFYGPHPLSDIINLDIIFKNQNILDSTFIPTRAGGNSALQKIFVTEKNILNSYILINVFSSTSQISIGTDKRKQRRTVSFLRKVLSLLEEYNEFYQLVKANLTEISNQKFLQFFSKSLVQNLQKITVFLTVEAFQANQGSSENELVNFIIEKQSETIKFSFKIFLLQIVGFDDFPSENFTSGAEKMLQIDDLTVIAKLSKMENVRQKFTKSYGETVIKREFKKEYCGGKNGSTGQVVYLNNRVLKKGDFGDKLGENGMKVPQFDGVVGQDVDLNYGQYIDVQKVQRLVNKNLTTFTFTTNSDYIQ